MYAIFSGAVCSPNFNIICVCSDYETLPKKKTKKKTTVFYFSNAVKAGLMQH